MTTTFKKMKSISAITAFCSIASCCPTQGAQAVPAIMPIITEFAIDLWPKIADRVRSLATREGQCMVCTKTGGVSCNATLFKRICKTRCQERVEMGEGYILKIRFAGKWNMRTCMDAQQKACMKAKGKKKKDGKDDLDCDSKPASGKREIAVYNKKDLDTAKELITTILACNDIIRTKGKITPKISKQAAEVARNDALKDISELFKEQGNFESANSATTLALFNKIALNNTILDSYSEEEDKRTPEERVKEATQQRDEAIAHLNEAVKTFGPQ